MLAEFMVLHGKHYYTAPAYPMLFAAGGVAAESLFAARGRWIKPAVIALVLAMAAVLVPVAVPVLPPDKAIAYMKAIHFEPPRTERSHTAALPQNLADQFGWEEMVQEVARVYHGLPPDDQAKAAIFGQNYGEAGAIDFFGPRYGLPPAISGHQNYFFWGPRGHTGEVVVVLDDTDRDERTFFASVEDMGPIQISPYAMPWERRLHVYVCCGLDKLWPHLKLWY